MAQPGSDYARAKNLMEPRDVEKAKALLAEAGAEGLTLQLVCTTDSEASATAQVI